MIVTLIRICFILFIILCLIIFIYITYFDAKRDKLSKHISIIYIGNILCNKKEYNKNPFGPFTNTYKVVGKIYNDFRGEYWFKLKDNNDFTIIINDKKLYKKYTKIKNE